MSRDTIVRVYSMTKIVVSVAALTLLEEGKLGLHDPVSEYLPEFRDLRVLVGGTAQDPQFVPADKALTVQHLFTHTSGIIYEAPGELIGEFYRQLADGVGESLEQQVSNLARFPLKWHPGTHFEYGFSTDVLGRVIEVVSGKRLDAYLNTRILEPLGTIDTGYAVTGARKERLAKVYQHGSDGDPASGSLSGGRDRRGAKKFSGRRDWSTFQPSTIMLVFLRCFATEVS